MEATNIRLKAALEATRLDRLFQRFSDEGIRDDILGQLKEEDLEKLGVARMGDRKRLITIFQKMFYQGVTGTALVEVKGGILPQESDFKGVLVKTFLIGRYPVLQEDWEWVRVWGICNGYDLGAGQSNGSFTPVTHVNWYDALKWCNANSEHAGLQCVYTCDGQIYRKGDFGPSGSKIVKMITEANGYRLPLEAEWEWAAIGGILGQQETTLANLPATPSDFPRENLHSLREPVFNALGIYNMTSNVWEWCWDHDDMQSAQRIRSGSLNDYGEQGRSKLRVSHSPDSRLSVLGFRLARNA